MKNKLTQRAKPCVLNYGNQGTKHTQVISESTRLHFQTDKTIPALLQLDAIVGTRLMILLFVVLNQCCVLGELIYK